MLRAGHGRLAGPLAAALAFVVLAFFAYRVTDDIRLADGTTRQRSPGWSLTALVAGAAAAVALGVPAAAGSPRRCLAWAVAVPLVPVGALVGFTVHPRSLSRLVGLSSAALAYGLPLAIFNAAGLWAFVRGRVMPTVLGSWLAWGAFVFWQGRTSVGR